MEHQNNNNTSSNGAIASRENRAKRKRELEKLRQENDQMREEREHLMETLELLRHELNEEMTTQKLVQENSCLRQEIKRHREFIESFARLVDGSANLSAESQMCKDGVESAHAYVQALIAESQSKWKELRFPENIQIPLEDFGVRYCFQRNFLGMTGSRRLNLRIDFKFRGISAENLSNFYWYVWNSPEEQRNLYGIKAIELERVNMPDQNTVLLYNRKTWNSGLHTPNDISWRDKDQHVVFICNRSEGSMLKSELRPPNAPVDDEDFTGNTEAITIALTSTRSTRETFTVCKNNNPYDNSQDSDHITSIISQGATCWNDSDGCARMVMVLSYPEEFRWVDVSFSDVVEKEFSNYGVAGIPFALMLTGIGERIRQILQSHFVHGPSKIQELMQSWNPTSSTVPKTTQM